MRQLISNIWEVTMKMCSNVHNLFWSNLQYLHNSYCATLPHNKFGCSILMQTTTYTWKITIVQFSSLTTGFKKLCIWLWLLTINKSPHSNLAYNTQQKYEKHRTIDYQVQVNSYNYPNITPVLLTQWKVWWWCVSKFKRYSKHSARRNFCRMWMWRHRVFFK